MNTVTGVYAMSLVMLEELVHYATELRNCNSSIILPFTATVVELLKVLFL